MDGDDEGNACAGKILGGIEDKGEMAKIPAATSGWDRASVREELTLKQLERHVSWFAFDWR